MSRTVANDALGWDVHNWYRALAFVDARLESDWLRGKRGLELGAGFNGGLSLWLALRGVRMTCSGCHPSFDDVSDVTKEIHRKYRLSDVIYERVDATRIPYTGSFDIVAFRSVIGGISRSADIETARGVVQQAEAALRPGGKLIMLENLAATPLHRYLRQRYGSGAHGWQYYSIGEFLSLLEGFHGVSYMATGFLGCFGRTERQRSLLGWIDGGLDSLIPSRWNYIVAIIAQK